MDVAECDKLISQIGFQGEDPATDFRGMGMSSLDDLVYFAKYHPEESKSALGIARHPISWYEQSSGLVYF